MDPIRTRNLSNVFPRPFCSDNFYPFVPFEASKNDVASFQAKMVLPLFGARTNLTLPHFEASKNDVASF